MFNVYSVYLTDRKFLFDIVLLDGDIATLLRWAKKHGYSFNMIDRFEIKDDEYQIIEPGIGKLKISKTF